MKLHIDHRSEIGSQTESHRRLTGCLVAWLAFLLTVLFDARVTGQDSALQRLPNEDAIYIWTNDVPTLIEHMQQSLLPDAAEIDELRALVERQSQTNRGRNTDVLMAQDAIKQLDRMTAFLAAMKDEEIFSGQAVLILPVETSGMKEPQGRMNSRPRGGIGAPQRIRAWSFIAESELSQAEFDSHLNFATPTMKKSVANDTAPESASEEPSNQPNGVWKCTDGWFCWTNSEARTDELLGYLSKQTTASSSLSEHRNFTTTFANLPAPFKHRASFSIFVTAEALPWLAMQLASESSFLSGIQFQDWRILMLDELRGLGARIYIAEEAVDSDLQAIVAVDAFLVMTQPRRGPFGALGNTAHPGIEYEMPIPALPLNSFLQFSIDGERLLKGIVDVQERLVAADPDLNESELDEDSPELQIIKPFVRMCEGRFDLGKSDDLRPAANSFPLMAFQTPDIDRLMELYALAAGDAQSRIDPADLDSPLSELDDDSFQAWGRSQTSLDQSRQYYESQISQIQSQIKHLQESSDENDRQQISALESSLSIQRSSLERLNDQETQPQLVILDDWLFSGGIQEAVIQQGLADGYDRTHPQLMQLQQDAEQLAEAFGNQRQPIAVIAAWADHLIARVRQSPGRVRKTLEVPSMSATESSSEDSSDPKLLDGFVRRQIDKLFFTLYADDDGFRIQGALLRPKLDDRDSTRY